VDPSSRIVLYVRSSKRRHTRHRIWHIHCPSCLHQVLPEGPAAPSPALAPDSVDLPGPGYMIGVCCSSLCRITAALAGVSCKSAAALAYGDSYCCSATPISPLPSGSERVDLPRLRFPEDELELLAVCGAVGVSIAEIGIRVVGA